MKRIFSLLGVALLLSVAIPAVADTILYTNGPLNGTIDSWNIGNFEVSNSFTLSSGADVETMSLGIWVPSGDIPSTLTFGFSASPFGTDLGSGTGTLSNLFKFTNGFGADVYFSSFIFSSVNLAAGTYYITLFNGFATNGGAMFWDENDGPSLAFQTTSTGSIPSESFTLDGTVIPEPGTLIMLGTGLVGIAGTIRRKLF